jgi:hypothetical protein
LKFATRTKPPAELLHENRIQKTRHTYEIHVTN